MIPIGTSIVPRRTPYANYALIGINIVIFLLSYWRHIVMVDGMRIEEPLREWAQIFMLTPVRPAVWQFVSYAFLHGGIGHILGNMYFLYMFGNNVNDKLGNLGYVCFYLAGAVFSGIGHAVLSSNPVLGASGAVAAVTGAYLVLFPKTVITILYIFIFIGTFDIPAIYFIAVKMIVIDNMLSTYEHVAYDAHLSGYAFGIFSMLLLLTTGLIRRSYYDLWGIMVQWNRRREFRDIVGSDGRRDRKRVKVREVEEQSANGEKISQIRSRISQLIDQRNLPEVVAGYLELVSVERSEVLPRQQQLDISNQLMSMGKWSESAEGYEKFLYHYQSYEYSEQVYLMLGVLYSRYLNQRDKARKSLEAALERLRDEGQLKMCRLELEKLEKEGDG